MHVISDSASGMCLLLTAGCGALLLISWQLRQENEKKIFGIVKRFQIKLKCDLREKLKS